METTRRARLVAGGLIVAVVGVLAATVVSRSGTKEVTIPAGTRFVGELQQTVSTERSHPGDRVEIRTAAPLELDERTTLPAGLVVRGEVTHSEGGGRIAGAPELTLRFTQLEVDGRRYSISAEPFRLRGKNAAGESAAEIGGGAVAGGIIGAVAGSAVKGAVIGAVLGTGVAVATEGHQIVLPVGQKLRVALADPVTVRYNPKAAKENVAKESK